jgi:hypothetical protein
MSKAKNERSTCRINPLNAKLIPFCHLLALLVHHVLHVSRVRVKYQHGTISVSIPGIFLKLHINNYMYIPYIRCELGCDQPIMETLLEKQ